VLSGFRFPHFGLLVRVPFLFLPLALLLIPALIALMVPFSIVQRYRAGTARRLARRWIAIMNVLLIAVSITMFLVTAAISSAWLHGALTNSVLGLAGGLVLGCIGIALTRWEAAPRDLHFTPNRWLVLTITIAVTARLAFGFWRAWQAWRWTPQDESWLAASGIAGSMAVGALVLGYYFAYWAGVWVRVRRHRSKGT
jgi:hypothetical protein